MNLNPRKTKKKIGKSIYLLNKKRRTKTREKRYLFFIKNHIANSKKFTSLTHCVQTRMRTTPVIHQAFVHIVTTMAVIGQYCARQSIARAIVATRQVVARVLTWTVSVSQAAFVYVCAHQMINKYTIEDRYERQKKYVTSLSSGIQSRANMEIVGKVYRSHALSSALTG